MKQLKNKPFTMICSLLCFCTVALVLFVTVYAQSGNTIEGCYNNGNGILRKVAAPSDCSPKETPISWNIVGPQGPAGPQGPSGASLISYDSGWFFSNSGPSSILVLTHNLGTTKMLVKVYFAEDNSGANIQEMTVDWVNGFGTIVKDITPTQLTVQPMNAVSWVVDSAGVRSWRTSGYLRVVAVALL